MPQIVKVYMIYVKGPFQNEDDIGEDLRSLNDLDPNDDYDVYLYGFTEDKEKLKGFFKYHKKDRFIVKKRKMTQKDFESFQGYHRSFMIKEYDVESPICMLKGLEPSTTDGVETFPMILSDMEITRISGVLEYYDDYITSKIPESNLKVISIIVKCATNEFKVALYNSGVIGLIQYLNLLYYGDSFDMDNSFIMVNELYVLLEYAGELFDFGGNKK